MFYHTVMRVASHRPLAAPSIPRCARPPRRTLGAPKLYKHLFFVLCPCPHGLERVRCCLNARKESPDVYRTHRIPTPAHQYPCPCPSPYPRHPRGNDFGNKIGKIGNTTRLLTHSILARAATPTPEKISTREPKPMPATPPAITPARIPATKTAKSAMAYTCFARQRKRLAGQHRWHQSANAHSYPTRDRQKHRQLRQEFRQRSRQPARPTAPSLRGNG